VITCIEPPTSDELYAAYRQARLRYAGVSFMKALMTPVIYQSLSIQALAARKKQQQDGQPAPLKQAA
jgi:hypothetical protein